MQKLGVRNEDRKMFKFWFFKNVIKPENAETFEYFCANLIHTIEVRLKLNNMIYSTPFVRKHTAIIIIFPQMHSLWHGIRWYAVQWVKEKKDILKTCSESAFQDEIPYVIFLFNVL